MRVTDRKQRAELMHAVEAVFRHGRLVLGPEVEKLEKQVAKRCDRKYAVAVNSGTDALFLALKSIDIGQGDEVITTAMSWIATANAIALTGATPIFADINEDLNIDPDSITPLITSKTKAILLVHFTGKICRMSEIMKIAQKHRLIVIEDAAQAFDACHHGQKAGSFGFIACFSMNPMKIFAACGEAGMVVTDENDVYERLLSLRYNGTVNRVECIEPSLNARMDTLQAAILLKRLRSVGRIAERRRKIASMYNTGLSECVDVPVESKGCRDVYYSYTLRTKHRDALKNFLEQKGIETKIWHPLLMPEHAAYRKKARGKYPKAKHIVKQILSIPNHEKLQDRDVRYIVESIRGFFKGKKS